MKPTKTWVIVANGDTARLFNWPGRNASLIPLDDHVWTAPEGNERADSPGMTFASVGNSPHRMALQTEADNLKLEGFARDVSDRLAESLDSGHYERLVIAAAPRFLGFLRNHMNRAVLAKVWIEIDKDFTHLPLTKLDATLAPYFFPD